MEIDGSEKASKFSGLFNKSESEESLDSGFNKQLISRRKEKKDDISYSALYGSSPDEHASLKTPVKMKKSNPFKFSKKDKKERDRHKETKESEDIHVQSKEKDIKLENCVEKLSEDSSLYESELDVSASKPPECDKEHKSKKKSSKEEKKDSLGNEKKERNRKDSFKDKERKKPSIASSAVETPMSEEPVFGVELSIATERSKCHDGVLLPLVVRECIDFVEENGLDCEGIYRLSAVKSKVQFLKERYDLRKSVKLDGQDPHTVACLLKLFLRELPEQLLTDSLVAQFEAAAALKQTEQRVQELKSLLDHLPAANRLLLQYLFKHMQHVIEQEKVNKMNAQNISLVLSATLQFSHRLLSAFFMHGKIFFDLVIIKKYVAPLSGSELPDDAETILEEIGKLESLLNHLHREIESGKCPQGREEQLWEAQRVLTQLKRKQKTLLCKQAGDQHGTVINETSAKDVPVENDAVPCSASTDDPVCSVIERRTRTVHMINEDNVTVIEIGERKPALPGDGTQSTSDATNAVCLTNDDSQSECYLDSLFREVILLKLHEQILVSVGKRMRSKLAAERTEIGRLKERVREAETFFGPRIPLAEMTDDTFGESFDMGHDKDAFRLLHSMMEHNDALEARNAQLRCSIDKELSLCQQLHAEIQYAELLATEISR